MIDRMMEALWNEFCPGTTRSADDTHHYRRGVEAVLEAMREPTEAMLSAGNEAAWFGSDLNEGQPNIAEAWSAMIDAAQLDFGEQPTVHG